MRELGKLGSLLVTSAVRRPPSARGLGLVSQSPIRVDACALREVE